jgi:hypothetical protein
MIRPVWRGDDGQRQLLAEVADDFRQLREQGQRLREQEERAWVKMQEARKSGIPDTVLCDRAEIGRSTLNRKLGSRQEDPQD